MAAVGMLYKSSNASIAQLVEQLICNQQVNGSSPFAGSIISTNKYGVKTLSLRQDERFEIK